MSGDRGGDPGRAGAGSEGSSAGATPGRIGYAGYAAACGLAAALFALAALLSRGPAASAPASAGTPAGAAAAPAGGAGAGRLEGDAVVALLREYLRIDTRNPPGNEIRAAAFFKRLFDADGIPAEVLEFAPGRANVVARLRGSGAKRPLILFNHMDVVNVERPFWTVDPFGGEIRDGYIYGRGALDMKTTGLLEAVTLINLKRAGERLGRDVLFVGTADEEVGALGVEWLAEERPDLVADAEFMLNEGGVIDAASGRARTWSVAVTEKSPFWVKVTARGRPGHGSVPFRKDNAVLALLRALDRLARYEPPPRVTPAAAAYFRARAEGETGARRERFRDIEQAILDPAFRRSLLAEPYFNAILSNTLSITMLQGSPQTNVIPTVAEARVDIRLLPGEDPEAFLRALRKVVEEPGVTVEPIGTFLPATASPIDSDLVRAIDRARARHHPGAVLAPIVLTGWTESAVMRRLGIEAYGFEPYVLDEAEQDRQHGNDERIAIDNVLRGARILEEIVLDVAR